MEEGGEKAEKTNVCRNEAGRPDDDGELNLG